MATRIPLHGLLLAVCICVAAAQYAEGPAPPRLTVPGAAPAPPAGPSRPRFLSGRQRRPQPAPASAPLQPSRPAYLPTPAADLEEAVTPPTPPTLPPRPVAEDPEEYDDEVDAPTPPPRPVRPLVRPQEQPQIRQQRPIAVQVSSPVGISIADIPVTPTRQAAPRPAVFRPERPLQVARQQQPVRPQELPPPIFRQPPPQRPSVDQQVFRQPQQPSRPAVDQQVFRQPQQPSRPAVEPQQAFRQPQQPSRPAVDQQVFRQPQQPSRPAIEPQQVFRQQPRPQVQQSRPQPKQHVKPAVDDDDDEEEVDVPRQQFRQKVQQPNVGVRQQQPQQHPRPNQVPSKVQRQRKPVAQVLRKYREDNPDGSITWGYENDDGSFKEETIGVDCVVSGKYGYVDPDGVRREYNYSSGTPCDKSLVEEEGGAPQGGGGYMDYETGEFVLPGGQIVDMKGVNKHKSRRPAGNNYGK